MLIKERRTAALPKGLAPLEFRAITLKLYISLWHFKIQPSVFSQEAEQKRDIGTTEGTK